MLDFTEVFWTQPRDFGELIQRESGLKAKHPKFKSEFFIPGSKMGRLPEAWRFRIPDPIDEIPSVAVKDFAGPELFQEGLQRTKDEQAEISPIPHASRTLHAEQDAIGRILDPHVGGRANVRVGLAIDEATESDWAHAEGESKGWAVKSRRDRGRSDSPSPPSHTPMTPSTSPRGMRLALTSVTNSSQTAAPRILLGAP